MPLSRQVIRRESSRRNLARRFGCLIARRAGAVILVSLSRGLEFLFEAEERPAWGFTTSRATSEERKLHSEWSAVKQLLYFIEEM